MEEINDEKRKSKKTILVAFVVLLLVLCIAFVGTLARYITTGSSSDQSVAAEFGLNVPTTIDLFSDSYTNVQANAEGKKIIAPGTEGHYDFVVTGTSEVAYQVSADIKLEYSSEWGSYAPLEFSLDGEAWTNFDMFQTNLSNALSTKIMQPNATYSSDSSIYWRWPFHTSTTNDEKDTEMGQLAAEGTAPQVTVTIEVIAAQID